MGGGKKSKAPKAPDYAAAAREQGAADKATAMYTTALDRPTQIGPYGSVTWQYGGSGGGAAAPNNSAALAAAQKALAAANAMPRGNSKNEPYANKQREQAIAKAQAQLAAAQKMGGGAVSGNMQNPMPGDWRQITTLTPEEQRIFNAEQANRLGLEGLAGTAIGRAKGTIGSAWNPTLRSFMTPQGLQKSTVGLPQFGGDRVGLANYAMQQNAPGMGADQFALGRYQQQANAPGMGADTQGLAANTLEGLQDVNESADQFGAQGQQVRDALYQQMTRFSDERFGREEQAERTRLAQMGLQEGTRAYQNALSEFRRSKDESYQGAQLASVLAGGQEQSRMIADQLASRQSNIGLRQGQFGQNMSRDQQEMAERLQSYQAGQNQWAQNQAERQFGFGADVTSNQQEMAERQQAYQAAQNQWGQNQSERQFGFGAGMARDAQDLAERQAAFQAGSTRYGLDQSERQSQATSQLNLANQAAAQRQQQFQEQAYGRSLPINEISALLGAGGGVNMPQFGQFAPSTPFSAPDMLGAQQAQYNAAMGAYNSQQSQKGGLLGAGAGLVGSFLGGK